MTTSNQAIDSLPYYDRDLDTIPQLRQRVEREIAAELKSSSTSTPHSTLTAFGPIPPSCNPTEHPLLAASFARVSQPNAPPYDPSKGEGLDASRFSLPGPPEGASVEEWQKAVDNAGAQLEHQRLRLANLELVGKYGGNSWKLANFLVEKDAERVEKVLEQRKEEVIEVNRRRKAMQGEAGTALDALENRWTELISANLQLEVANTQLERELHELRRAEAGLKAKMEVSS